MTFPPVSVPPPAWPAARHLTRPQGVRLAYRCWGAALAGPGSEAPWLLLHGGPGSGCQPGLLRPFDGQRQTVVAPDQRGSGDSRPRGRVVGHHVAALVADIEALRRHLGVVRWAGVLAGSWGTVLALAYAAAHPDHVPRLVLRGAFALRRAEVGGLLEPRLRHRGWRGAPGDWPAGGGAVLLRRLEQLLQTGTPGVAALHALRQWGWLEQAAAAHGLRRSLRHLSGPGGDAALAAAVRAEWAVLRRRQRSTAAGLRRPGRRPADRLAGFKYRLQARCLRRRAGLRTGALDRAMRGLALAGVRVDWVHGRFDAICPPRNSRRWLALGQRLAPAQVAGHWPLAGHLGSEPAMQACLAALVRPASPGRSGNGPP